MLEYGKERISGRFQSPFDDVLEFRLVARHIIPSFNDFLQTKLSLSALVLLDELDPGLGLAPEPRQDSRGTP
jgi:hypothetical protein